MIEKRNRRGVIPFAGYAFLICAAVLVGIPAIVTAAAPEPPRVFLDTTLPDTAGYTIVSVPPSGDLQAALDAADCNTVIKLHAGTTYVGNFLLPARGCTGWVIVTTDSSAIPPPGQRVTPSNAASMPKLITTISSPIIVAMPGASSYRFVGIEFASVSSLDFNLIWLDPQSANPADFPSNFIFDRVYVHGGPSSATRRGIMMNSRSTAVIDSYISDIHSAGVDSQAIASTGGPGPFKIVNNTLEAASEVLLFGGAFPSVPGTVPSDIEVRGNHLFRPLSWFAGSSDFAGTQWYVKNLFEIKSARRVLFEGNVLENNWAEGQSGFAFVFTPRSGDSGFAAVNDDIMVRNNITRRSAPGASILAADYDDVNRPADLLQAHRISFLNNLFEQIDSSLYGGDGRLFQLLGSPVDVQIEHNTGFVDVVTMLMYINSETKIDNLIFNNNVASHGVYGIFGSGGPFCQGMGTAALCLCAPNATFVRNVLEGADGNAFAEHVTNSGLNDKCPSLFISQNYFPATWDEVKFVDMAGGNYTLQSASPASPYRNLATDGTDIGVNYPQLVNATRGALSGIWSGPNMKDVVPPSVTIASPPPGEVTGTIQVMATAGDNVGVAAVKFTLDGATLHPEDTVPPYTQLIDTTTLAYGSHVLVAIARDTSGNTTAANSVTVVRKAPGPVISNVQVQSNQKTAKISWTTDIPSTTEVQYGTTTGLGTSRTDSSQATAHSLTINNLTSGVTYFFQVTSVDSNGGRTVSPMLSFKANVNTVPAISNVQVNPGIAMATFTWTTDLPATTQVQFGLTTSLGSSTLLDSAFATAHTVIVTGLSPNTTYYYKVLSSNVSGTTASAVQSFKTAADGTPLISNLQVQPGLTSATVTWTTDMPATTQVQYGTTTNLGSSTVLDSTLTTSHTQVLNGLSSGTIYYLQVLSSANTGGTGAATSPVQSFQTQTALTLSNVVFQAGPNSATITWTTNLAATSEVRYGPTANLGQSNVNATLTTSHSVTLSNLTEGATYYFQVFSSASANGSNPTSAPVQSFQTQITISNIVVQTSATAATVTWTTGVATTSEVRYGTTASLGQSRSDLALTTAHGVTLTTLSPGTTYYFQVLSSPNANGANPTSSPIQTFQTQTVLSISNVVVQAATNSATITWTTNLAATSEVQYGPTASLGQSNANATLTTSHSITLSSLTEGATYYFQVLSSTSANGSNPISVPVQSFQTQVVVTMTNIVVQALATTATITWSTNIATTSEVRYGTTPSLGQSRADLTLTTSHSITLSSLLSGTTYSFQVLSSTNPNGTNPTGSPIQTFQTQTVLSISNVGVSASQRSATITWTTSLASTSEVRYGTTQSLGQTVSDATPVTSHSITLNNLSTGTTFYFQVFSTTSGGGAVSSAVQTFKTTGKPGGS